MKSIKSLARALIASVAVFSASALAADDGCVRALDLADDDPAAAREMLGAVSDCSGGAAGSALLAAYVEYKLNQGSREAAALSRAISDYEKADGPPSRLVALAYYEVARRQLSVGNKRAIDTAARAEAALQAAAPEDLPRRARAILAKAAARINKKPNFSSDFVEAYKDASRARELFVNADPTATLAYLGTVAWQAAILGLIAGERRANVEDADALAALSALPSACNAFWDRSALAVVKRRLAWSGSLVGAGAFYGVVAVVDADADGKAKLVGIAAESRLSALGRPPIGIVDARFNAVEKALQRWRLAADAPEECRTGALIPLGVYIPEAPDSGFDLSNWPSNAAPSE